MTSTEKSQELPKKSINDNCPFSGKKVQDDSITEYRGYNVGFCNPNCKDDFAKAITLFDGLINDMNS